MFNVLVEKSNMGIVLYGMDNIGVYYVVVDGKNNYFII